MGVKVGVFLGVWVEFGVGGGGGWRGMGLFEEDGLDVGGCLFGVF